MTRIRGGFKKFIFILTAMFFCLIVTLVAAEGVLRLTQSTPYHRNALNSFHVKDLQLGWRGLPGFTGIFARSDFKATIAIDDNGYRKRGSRTKPAPGAEKSVFLGDSFAWGWGVSQGELFSDALQDLLGDGHNVINMGINTFGTVQEWIQLEREVLEMSPARVGVLFYENDFEDNLNGRGDTRPYCKVQDGRVVLKNLPVANPIGGSLRSFTRHSYALTHLRYYHNIFREHADSMKRRFRRWMDEKRGVPSEPAVSPLSTEGGAQGRLNEDAITVFDHALSNMERLCRENGIDFFVVYVPRGENIASDRPDYEYNRVVRRVCREHGIPFVDLKPDFTSRVTGRRGEPLYFRRDLHWTPEGHRLAAEILFRRVYFGQAEE